MLALPYLVGVYNRTDRIPVTSRTRSVPLLSFSQAPTAIFTTLAPTPLQQLLKILFYYNTYYRVSQWNGPPTQSAFPFKYIETTYEIFFRFSRSPFFLIAPSLQQRLEQLQQQHQKALFPKLPYNNRPHIIPHYACRDSVL